MASGLENIETIESPFRRFVTTIGVFPTAFTDAMTYYECLAYLVKYIEDTVIPAVNENAEALEELQQYYIQLKSYVDNYFANLDVQDEIDNKLDEMAEAGTLQEIISSYIQANVSWTFDTVADMKQATNLVAGSYARTIGFHTINDGGGATYFITDSGSANEMDIIAVGSLYANLVLGNQLNIKQLGATTSSEITAHYKRALEISNNILIDGIDGTIETYPVITIGSNTTITVINSTLYTKANVTAGSHQDYRTGLFYVLNATGVNLIGQHAELYGDMASHSGTQHQWNAGIRVLGCKDVNISGFKCTKHTGDGIVINDSEDVFVDNCEITDNFRNGISPITGKHYVISNSNFYHNGYNLEPKSAIDVEPDPGNKTIDDVVIKNCVFTDNYLAILLHDPNWNDTSVTTSQIRNITIIDNEFDNTENTSASGNRAITVQGIKSGQVIFANNKIKAFKDSCLIQFSKNLEFVNNIISDCAQYAFDIRDCSYSNFKDNKFTNITARCFWCKRLNNSLIDNNEFNSGKQIFIQLMTDNTGEHCDNNIISNNRFYSYVGTTLINQLITASGYASNNIFNNNICYFTSEYVNYFIRITDANSANNIVMYNTTPTMHTDGYQITSGHTLMNINGYTLEKGTLFV